MKSKKECEIKLPIQSISQPSKKKNHLVKVNIMT